METPSERSSSQDESFLDDVLDVVAERVADGQPVDVEELTAPRPHLRGQVEALVVKAREAAVRRLPVYPTLAGYQVLRELGRGGMGTVYLARHERLGRQVALKVLPVSATLSTRARHRFLAEARALARFNHQSVVKIHDVIEEGDFCAYAMEWVEGPSLADIIRYLRRRSAKATLSDVLQQQGLHDSAGHGSLALWLCRLAIAVARALGEVHRSGLLHRDVKPSNILVKRDGTPLLSDFGLVRESEGREITRSGSFLGTPAYAAPEQLRGESEAIDARTDVYSLGVTLYEALCTKLPYAGRTTAELLKEVERGAPQPLRRINPRLPKDLETIVTKAIDPEPARRYASADELADDLERLLNLQPILARPAGLATRLLKLARRERRIVTAAAAGGVVVAVMAVLLAAYRQRQAEIPKLVEEAVQRARLALLDPGQGERIYVATLLHRKPSEPEFRSEQAGRALGEYDEALRLAPERVDIVLEREVVELARAIAAGERNRSPSKALERSCPVTCAVAREWLAEGVGSGGDAVDLEKVSREDRRLLGLLAFLCGDAALAIRAWDGLDLSIEHPDPLVDAALGETFLVVEQPARAYPRLLRAFEALPRAGFLGVDLADAALGCGEVEVASRFLEVARQESPPELKALNRNWARVQADLLAAQGRKLEARGLYEWLRRKHQAPSVRLHYGRFLMEEGELAEAVRVFRELTRHRPEVASYREELQRAARAWWGSFSAGERLARALRFFGGDSLPDRDVLWIMLEQLGERGPASSKKSAIVSRRIPSPDLQVVSPEDLRRTLEVFDMNARLPRALRKLVALESLFPGVKPVSRTVGPLLQGWALVPKPRGVVTLLVTAAITALVLPRAVEGQDLRWSAEGEWAGDEYGYARPTG
ncbi:MAG: protein kinase, partial [Planctomycetota bacterium]